MNLSKNQGSDTGGPYGDGDVFKGWEAPVRIQVAHMQSSWTLVSSHT